jgi:dsRNA-specific ribonuclease
MRPTFHFREDVNTKLIIATLMLPNCVDPSVRRASSQHQWRTEKMAVKDAAFQAYIALYAKGLVNDNLLPLLGYDEERPADVETRQAFCDVSQTYDPLVVIAREWMKLDILYRKVISIERPGQPALSIDMILPRRFASFGPFTLYWDEKTTYTVSIHDPASSTVVSAAFLPTMRLVTSTILRSVHSSRMTSDTDDFLVLFTPCIDQADLGSWLVANAGEFPASDLHNTLLEHRCGLIREPSLHGAPHILQDFGVDDTIRVLALPKRRDFLHYGYPDRQEQDKSGAGLKETKTRMLPVQSSTVDKLSLDFVECSLLIPSILHQLLRRLLALDLSSSLLKDVAFDNVEYIITATNAPSANETTNYQQLEFFGDSVLKFLVSIHLYQAHKSWPEGYLSRAKDQMVANSRLARAGVEAKLDRYIVSEPFTAKKWAPAYVSNYSQPVVTGKRTLSTKVLADVVEALIGGAFLAGGLENAAACTSQLLPEISATILNSNSFTGSDSSKSPQLPNDYFSGLERFLGHKFRDSRLLKEALTHPSCQNDADTLSYQRLEFIGDAALDMLIISYLTEHAPSLPPGRLHLIKAAMVNAGLLAYLCLKAVVQQDVVDVHSNHETLYDGFTFEERRSSRSVRLCRFMQHQHANIEIALQNCDTRFEQMQSDITKCLKYGTYYPWVLLTSLAHEKFVSDIIESLFGAILIDNAGNIQACQVFAEKLGLLNYLRRVVEEDIDLRHPKNILGEIASGRTVEYDIGVQEGTEGYFCIVRVSGMDVAKAFNGSSPDEVTTRAAHAAIDLVRG